jgi:dihydrofolate synthase/folylpolyglutamate synthase
MPESAKPSYEVPFEVRSVTYDDALAILHSALHFGIQPMLESVEDMLEELGRPDSRYACLQIAGTNGKTSTARYAAAILAGEGLSTALYTSPELVSYTERMEVGGNPVSEGAFAHGIAAAELAGRRVNRRRQAAGERPYDITEFDLLTVAATVVYAEAGVDVAVLECGMGGRWDATSAVSSIRAVGVTGVGLDHTRILGDTLEKISAEKAAIIQAGRTCVLGVGTATPDSVEDVFLGRCEGEGVVPTLLRPVSLADAPGEMHPGEPRSHPDLPHASYVVTHHPTRLGDELVLDVTTPLATYAGLSCAKPIYQATNVACAVALAETFLGRPLDAGALRTSVAACPTPGRFDVLSGAGEPLVMMDAAHNPQSIATFLSAVREVERDVAHRPQLLCAILADKDCAGIVHLLAHEFPRVSVCRTDSSRALAPGELADLFRAEGVEPADVWPDVPTAVAGLAGRSYVAVGSITLAGAVAKELR